jgi:hemoglobin
VSVQDEVTLYDAVGGMPFFEALVDRFYDGVQADAILLRLYPEPHDLGPARHKLTLFLAQYWGGPTTYHEERGHPALRMRHAPFAIGSDERDRWLVHMRAAVVAMDPPSDVAQALTDYFEVAADSLRNQLDDH